MNLIKKEFCDECGFEFDKNKDLNRPIFSSKYIKHYYKDGKAFCCRCTELIRGNKQ